MICNNTILRQVLVVFLLLSSLFLSGQENQSDKTFGVNYINIPLDQVLADLEIRSKMQFYFKSEDIPLTLVNITAETITVENMLEQVLKPTMLSFINYRDHSIVIIPRKIIEESYSLSYLKLLEEGKKKTTRKFDGITIGELDLAPVDGKVQVTGKVTDANTGEEIIGASVLWTDLGTGDITDNRGKFEFSLDVGEHVMEIQFVGYQDILKTVKVLSDGRINIKMDQDLIALEEVVITATAEGDKVNNTNVGFDRLTVADIKKLPSLLGEADVIQSILIQPGVSSVGEGAIGFNVRGGDADQNLIIQDEAMIFNSSHALGFVSIFNPDLIKGVGLYKGNIPAEYGGRLASVMDVEFRDGDFEQMKLNASIGIFSLKGVFEAPIIKNKTSLITGYRTSFSNWALKAATEETVKNSAASFYDWNGRLTHKFSNVTTLTLSGYLAADNFEFNNEFGFNYETKLGQLIFKTLIGDQLSSSTYINVSQYNTTQTDFDDETPSEFNNGVEYLKVKEKLKYTVSEELSFNGGVSGIIYGVEPGERIPLSTQGAQLAGKLEKEKGIELGAFLGSKFSLGSKFAISAGLRFSNYAYKGPNDVFVYGEAGGQTIGNIVDTLSYGSETIKTYSNIEPRVSFRYSLSDDASIKGGYSRTAQYINQIFNTDSPTPTSQWQLSTFNIKPNLSHNYSVGYFQNFDDNNIEFSTTVFYRTIDQLFDYKGFADLFVNEHIETELLEGTGTAYGVELSVKKQTGKLSGVFSYTYSRSLRVVPGINRGEEFPSNFDKPHEGSLILSYQPNKRNTITFNFSYAKGRPTSPPVAGYKTDNNVFVPIFANRNQLRIPDYQRMDVAFTSGQGYQRKKRLRLNWTFSIYNVLGRQNAYSVFFTRGAFNRPDAKKLSILGNALPAVTLNFEWK